MVGGGGNMGGCVSVDGVEFGGELRTFEFNGDCTPWAKFNFGATAVGIEGPAIETIEVDVADCTEWWICLSEIATRADGVLRKDWFPHVRSSSKRTMCLRSLGFAGKRRKSKIRIE